MCSKVTGGRLAFGGGWSFPAVVHVAFSSRSPCQGAAFSVCQKRRPASQLSTVLEPTWPTQAATKEARSSSEAGIRSASATW